MDWMKQMFYLAVAASVVWGGLGAKGDGPGKSAWVRIAADRILANIRFSPRMSMRDARLRPKARFWPPLTSSSSSRRSG